MLAGFVFMYCEVRWLLYVPVYLRWWRFVGLVGFGAVSGLGGFLDWFWVVLRVAGLVVAVFPGLVSGWFGVISCVLALGGR